MQSNSSKNFLSLVNCHMMTTLTLTVDQLERFSRGLSWSDVFSSEMKNVRICALERKTQLSIRNKKPVLLDT